MPKHVVQSHQTFVKGELLIDGCFTSILCVGSQWDISTKVQKLFLLLFFPEDGDSRFTRDVSVSGLYGVTSQKTVLQTCLVLLDRVMKRT
jgi:hypothetical protein